jgi:hypothetical protein
MGDLLRQQVLIKEIMERVPDEDMDKESREAKQAFLDELDARLAHDSKLKDAEAHLNVILHGAKTAELRSRLRQARVDRIASDSVMPSLFGRLDRRGRGVRGVAANPSNNDSDDDDDDHDDEEIVDGTTLSALQHAFKGKDKSTAHVPPGGSRKFADDLDSEIRESMADPENAVMVQRIFTEMIDGFTTEDAITRFVALDAGYGYLSRLPEKKVTRPRPGPSHLLACVQHTRAVGAVFHSDGSRANKSEDDTWRTPSAQVSLCDQEGMLAM